MRVEKKAEPVVSKPGLADKETPQPISKIIIMAILVVVATGFFWFLVANIFEHGISLAREGNNLLMLTLTILVFCLMLAINGLAAVIVRNFLWFFLMITVGAFTYFCFFKLNIWALGPFILSILAFSYWRQAIGADMKSRIKFMPKKTISVGLHMTISLMILAVALAYGGFFVQQQGGSSKVVEGMSKSAASAVNNLMPSIYKGYRPSMTLDEFILSGTSSIADGALNLGKDTESQKAVKEVVTKAQQTVLDESRGQFLKTFKIEATGNEPMRSVIEKVVLSKFEPALKPYEKFIPFLIVLSLYFLLSIFLFIYKILAESFSFIVFMILKWSHFVQIKKVSVEAEKITL